MTQATLLEQYRSNPREYSLDEARAYCADLAVRHYENFTVVSWFLPDELRQDFFNVYAFCRWADDLGDELGSAERAKEELAWWEAELDRCYEGRSEHPVYLALGATIQKFDLPKKPFQDLIHAFRLDQERTRHASYEDLLAYCRYSANPVGHLVLYLSGYRDETRRRLSDHTCTALQLTNFWQDVARDYRMGRIYIPLEDMRRFAYTERELAEGVCNENFRALMAFEVERTRRLFHQGMKLVDLLDGRVKRDVKLFHLGGLKILEKIEAMDYRVLQARPVLGKLDKIRLMMGIMVPGRSV